MSAAHFWPSQRRPVVWCRRCVLATGGATAIDPQPGQNPPQTSPIKPQHHRRNQHSLGIVARSTTAATPMQTSSSTRACGHTEPGSRRQITTHRRSPLPDHTGPAPQTSRRLRHRGLHRQPRLRRRAGSSAVPGTAVRRTVDHITVDHASRGGCTVVHLKQHKHHD